MATQRQDNATRGKARLFLWACLGLALLASLNFTVLSSSTSTEGPDEKRASPPPPIVPGYIERVDQLARQSGGVFQRLSAADQGWLTRFLPRNAEEVLRTRGQLLTKQDAKRRATRKGILPYADNKAAPTGQRYGESED